MTLMLGKLTINYLIKIPEAERNCYQGHPESCEDWITCLLISLTELHLLPVLSPISGIYVFTSTELQNDMSVNKSGINKEILMVWG